jgi:hypothetical protein
VRNGKMLFTIHKVSDWVPFETYEGYTVTYRKFNTVEELAEFMDKYKHRIIIGPNRYTRHDNDLLNITIYDDYIE